MKPPFRLLMRTPSSGAEDVSSGQPRSLHTKVRAEGVRLLHGRNAAHAVPFANLQMARASRMASGPNAATRTRKDVCEASIQVRPHDLRRRWRIATADKALAQLIDRRLIEPRAGHRLKSMAGGRHGSRRRARPGADWGHGDARQVE